MPFSGERGRRDQVELVYTYPVNRVHSNPAIAQWAAPELEARRIRTETFFNVERIDPQRRVIETWRARPTLPPAHRHPGAHGPAVPCGVGLGRRRLGARGPEYAGGQGARGDLRPGRRNGPARQQGGVRRPLPGLGGRGQRGGAGRRGGPPPPGTTARRSASSRPGTTRPPLWSLTTSARRSRSAPPGGSTGPNFRTTRRTGSRPGV